MLQRGAEAGGEACSLCGGGEAGALGEA